MTSPRPETSPKTSPVRALANGCLALAVAAVPTFGVLAPGTAFAQDAEYDGGKARVSRSASLRSLTEAVAAASCRVNAGINVEHSRHQLAEAQQTFDRILNALIDGDAALGMPHAEERGRTLAELRKAQAMWQPISEAAARLAAGEGTEADAAFIAENRAMLFDETMQLASVIAGEYTNPQQLLQSDATVLNFAIRQRAFAYRMAREMCELASGEDGGDLVMDLDTTISLFDQTLMALRDGFPAAGINPPPNEIVAGALSDTVALWRARKGVFGSALDYEVPDEEMVSIAADLSLELSRQMSNVITLYLLAAPSKNGIYRVPVEAFARGQLSNWLTDPALIEAIRAQNAAHAGLSDEDVIALDQQWRAEAGASGGPLIDKLLTHPVSGWLLQQQESTAGFVTEVFVMDNKGLNVAQSAQTSDYWQGDEAKWQQTFPVGGDALHISDVEFDDSTGYYQSQASMPIVDPETGETIGAITYGINVQSLL